MNTDPAFRAAISHQKDAEALYAHARSLLDDHHAKSLTDEQVANVWRHVAFIRAHAAAHARFVRQFIHGIP